MQSKKANERDVYKTLIFVFSVLLFGLMVFNLSNAAAAVYSGGITMPTTRVDGAPILLDEIREATIVCAVDVNGPFDAHTHTIADPTASMAVEMTMPENRDYWCKAFVTDTNDLESGFSNVVLLDYVPAPPGAPTLDSFSITININFGAQ
ncbi:MAG: hypothetical protein AB2747_05370 [Candidatus Thiodiazotropha taylori]